MSKRTTLLVLAAMFFGPLIVAWVWFFHFGDVRPDGTVNKGDLVQPTISVADQRFVDGVAEVTPFRQVWTILFVAPDGCDAQCLQALYVTRQVWIRLNKDADRVQRMIVTREGVEAGFDRKLHPALLSFKAGEDFFSRFRREGDPAVSVQGKVYLVDPLGNVMMSYPLTLEPKMLHEDLKRLLKYSQVG